MPHTGLIFKLISQIIIRLLASPKIQGVSKNSQSFDADFVHVDNPTTSPAFLCPTKTHTQHAFITRRITRYCV